jgi:PTS system fructose-specific IIC component
MKLLAVTTHPDPLADALEHAAADAGHEIALETPGAAGSTPFTPEQLAEADAAILATGAEVPDPERFAHVPTVRSGAIGDAGDLVGRAVAAARSPRPPAGGASVAATVRGWLTSGVSYVIPFVTAGGLLIALGYALGGHGIGEAPPVTEGFDGTTVSGWAALLFQLGGLAFDFLVPVLGGFIAYAVAGRPALVSGFVGGAVAVVTGAGYLGGLVAGLLAGAVVHQLTRWRPPRAVAGTMPALVLPLVGTLVTGAVMWVVVGAPLAAATSGLTSWLNGLSGGNAVALGAVVGLMMAVDMGGPVNKAAYAFAVAGLSTGADTAPVLMAAVMAAGMTPPLAVALASTLRPRLFTGSERENGRAAWLLGASFITEGAIPFAAADPLRVIPSLMAGSSVAAALSIALGSSLHAPHGGVFVIGLIGGPVGHLVAVVAGTAVSAALVVALKSVRRGDAAVAASAA